MRETPRGQSEPGPAFTLAGHPDKTQCATSGCDRDGWPAQVPAGRLRLASTFACLVSLGQH